VPQYPALDPETYHDARTVAAGNDVYSLEKETRIFWMEGAPDEGIGARIADCRRAEADYGREPFARRPLLQWSRARCCKAVGSQVR
jgi:hypothetical protein